MQRSLEEGAFLSIHDPKVSKEKIQHDLGIEPLNSDINYSERFDFFNFEGNGFFEESIYKAAEKSDAVVVLTEWEEYTKIDLGRISKKMRKPSWVFDTRSILNKKEIINNELLLWRIGDGSNKIINIL